MVTSGLSLLAWLAIAWGVVTAILVALAFYRGMIGMHREEQVFLTSAARGFEAESAQASAQAAKLTPYIRTTGVLSAALAVAVIVEIVLSVMRQL